MTNANEESPLNPFDLLESRLTKIDCDRDQAISNHPDPGSVDRTASISALSALKEHLNSCGIESSAIDRLLVQLAALHEGGKPPPMFAPAAIPHRAPDNTAIQMLKGSLAAIMRLRQDEHVKRRPAAQWVVDHASRALLKRIAPNPGAVTWRTVAAWHDKFNAGPRGTPGRVNYDLILERGRQARRNGRANPAEILLAIIEQNFIDRLPVLVIE